MDRDVSTLGCGDGSFFRVARNSLIVALQPFQISRVVNDRNTVCPSSSLSDHAKYIAAVLQLLNECVDLRRMI